MYNPPFTPPASPQPASNGTHETARAEAPPKLELEFAPSALHLAPENTGSELESTGTSSELESAGVSSELESAGVSSELEPAVTRSEPESAGASSELESAVTSLELGVESSPLAPPPIPEDTFICCQLEVVHFEEEGEQVVLNVFGGLSSLYENDTIITLPPDTGTGHNPEEVIEPPLRYLLRYLLGHANYQYQRIFLIYSDAEFDDAHGFEYRDCTALIAHARADQLEQVTCIAYRAENPSARKALVEQLSALTPALNLQDCILPIFGYDPQPQEHFCEALKKDLETARIQTTIFSDRLNAFPEEHSAPILISIPIIFEHPAACEISKRTIKNQNPIFYVIFSPRVHLDPPSTTDDEQLPPPHRIGQLIQYSVKISLERKILSKQKIKPTSELSNFIFNIIDKPLQKILKTRLYPHKTISPSEQCELNELQEKVEHLLHTCFEFNPTLHRVPLAISEEVLTKTREAIDTLQSKSRETSLNAMDGVEAWYRAEFLRLAILTIHLINISSIAFMEGSPTVLPSELKDQFQQHIQKSRHIIDSFIAKGKKIVHTPLFTKIRGQFVLFYFQWSLLLKNEFVRTRDRETLLHAAAFNTKYIEARSQFSNVPNLNEMQNSLEISILICQETDHPIQKNKCLKNSRQMLESCKRLIRSPDSYRGNITPEYKIDLLYKEMTLEEIDYTLNHQIKSAKQVLIISKIYIQQLLGTLLEIKTEKQSSPKSKKSKTKKKTTTGAPKNQHYEQLLRCASRRTTMAWELYLKSNESVYLHKITETIQWLCQFYPHYLESHPSGIRFKKNMIKDKDSPLGIPDRRDLALCFLHLSQVYMAYADASFGEVDPSASSRTKNDCLLLANTFSAQSKPIFKNDPFFMFLRYSILSQREEWSEEAQHQVERMFRLRKFLREHRGAIGANYSIEDVEIIQHHAYMQIKYFSDLDPQTIPLDQLKEIIFDLQRIRTLSSTRPKDYASFLLYYLAEAYTLLGKVTFQRFELQEDNQAPRSYFEQALEALMAFEVESTHFKPAQLLAARLRNYLIDESYLRESIRAPCPLLILESTSATNPNSTPPDTASSDKTSPYTLTLSDSDSEEESSLASQLTPSNVPEISRNKRNHSSNICYLTSFLLWETQDLLTFCGRSEPPVSQHPLSPENGRLNPQSWRLSLEIFSELPSSVPLAKTPTVFNAHELVMEIIIHFSTNASKEDQALCADLFKILIRTPYPFFVAKEGAKNSGFSRTSISRTELLRDKPSGTKPSSITVNTTTFWLKKPKIQQFILHENTAYRDLFTEENRVELLKSSLN